MQIKCPNTLSLLCIIPPWNYCHYTMVTSSTKKNSLFFSVQYKEKSTCPIQLGGSNSFFRQFLIKTWLCAHVICPTSCHSPGGPEYQAHGCSSRVWSHLVLKNKEEKSQNPFKTKAFISSCFFFLCVCQTLNISPSVFFQLLALNGSN